MNKLKLICFSLFMGIGLTLSAQKVDFDYKVDSVTTGKTNGDSITTTAFPTTIRFERKGDTSILKIRLGGKIRVFTVNSQGSATEPNAYLCLHRFMVKGEDGLDYPLGLIFMKSNHKLIGVAITEGNWTILFGIREEMTLEG